MAETTESPSLVGTHTPTRSFRLGRKSQTQNVMSGKVKQNIIAVFEGLGGWEQMLIWAKKHQDLFYGTIYPKLLPTEWYEKGSGSIRVFVYAPQQSPSDKPVVLADSASMHLIEAAEQAEVNTAKEHD